MVFFCLVDWIFGIELLKIYLIKTTLTMCSTIIFNQYFKIINLLDYLKINFAVNIDENRIWGKQDH